jgi:Uma2 family endonuclease
MSSAYKILPHYTYADYLHWEGQWELIEGIPHAMSPAPGLRHQHIAGRLYTLLSKVLENNTCNCMAFLPLDYKVAEDTVVQPDILVVCNPELERKVLEKTPALVAEVLSPSTALKDRNSKYHLYEEAGVPYYLIVDTEKSVIELYQQVNDSYQLQQIDLVQPYTLEFDGCSVQISFNNIWS